MPPVPVPNEGRHRSRAHPSEPPVPPHGSCYGSLPDQAAEWCRPVLPADVGVRPGERKGDVASPAIARARLHRRSLREGLRHVHAVRCSPQRRALCRHACRPTSPPCRHQQRLCLAFSGRSSAPRPLLHIRLLPTLSCIGRLALSSSRSASPSPAALPRPLRQATCSTTTQTTYRCSGWSAPPPPPPPSPLLVNPERLITYSLGLHHLHLHHQRRRQRSPRCRRLRLHGQAPHSPSPHACGWEPARPLAVVRNLSLGAGADTTSSTRPEATL